MRLLVALLLMLAALGVAHAQSHANDKNKLVEFKNAGAWEIWCLDLAGSGTIECNLNLVIIYKPRPDFRATIPRIYAERDGSWRALIGVERQTTLGHGAINVDGRAFSLAECDRPCVLIGARAGDLITLMEGGKQAKFHFHDYLIESWEIDLPLDGFAQGLKDLRALQEKYRR